MGKHAHNCITQIFESRRETLAPHASNAQGGPLSKRGGCVHTLRIPLAYGLVFSLWHMTNRTFVLFFFTLPIPVTESTQSMVTSMKQTFERR